MHDCLYISEIVSRVCTELRLGSLAPKARGQKGFCFGDIARLARTCHALRDPALDALWHTLPSLAPLVRTLPADLWEEREAAEDEYGNTNREIVLLRLVEESDWARFAVYAPRVRALNYCDNSRWGGRAVFLDAGTTAALYTSAPKHLHLPNLLSIALDEEDPDHLLSNIAVLAHPDVASLTLKYPDDDLDSRIALLMALPAAFPALTCLAVDRSRGSVCEGDDPRITAALTKVIGACTRLETLRVTGLTPSALHAVATLPSLRALTVLSHVHMDFDTQHPPSLHTYPHSQQPFPALRALALLNPPPDAATAFLSLLPRIHALTDVEIYAPAHPPHRPEPWRALFEALAKHSSLVRVVVQGNFYADGSEAASGGDMLAIISPLLAFHRLEKLHVTLPLAVDLDDASVRVIAASWPRLRVLDLLARPAWRHHSSRISLAAFSDLVLSCAELCELSIAVDFGSGRISPQLTGGTPNTHLWRLDTGHSPVGEVPGAAAFLSAVCPNLCNIDAQEDCEEWKEVARLVAVWRQERHVVRGR